MTTKTECVHHWYYPVSEGLTCRGKCLKCGKTQEAKNYLDMSCDNKYAYGYHRENKARYEERLRGVK